MSYLFQKVLVWLGGYFPFIPRLFGLKILTIGYIDITPDIGCGSRPNSRIVESKISWLVKSEWGSPIPVKIVMACVQPEDVWAQVYPVNQALHGDWNRDASCGEEKFDPDLRQKCKNTVVPAYGLLKIDHFAGQHPHPSCGSDFAFQLVPDDSNVIILRKDLFNQKSSKWRHSGMRFLLAGIGIIVAVCIVFHYSVQYGLPLWEKLVP